MFCLNPLWQKLFELHYVRKLDCMSIAYDEMIYERLPRFSPNSLNVYLIYTLSFLSECHFNPQ